MAKTNFQFEKRQRELAKKRKKEEKLRRKQEGLPDDTPENQEPDEGSEGAANDDAPPAVPAA